MATYTIHQIPTSRAAVIGDEVEVQATGGGQSARVTAESIAALGGPTGPTGATGPAGTLTGLPVIAWSSLPTYDSGQLVLDRGGIWQATGANTNSEPISGNANWTLVGGVPYVEVVLDPVALTTAPFYDPVTFLSLTVIPAPGAGLMIMPRWIVTNVTPGDDWAAKAVLAVGYSSAGLILSEGIDYDIGPYLALKPTPGNLGLSFFTVVGALDNSGNGGNNLSNCPFAIQTGTDVTGGGLTFGTRSASVRVYYTLLPTTIAVDTFYAITAVNQGSKTITVTDVGAVLNGATGTFAVVGSTGNNGTYTIVSAVSGAGSTVITTVEAIPSATGDGWAEFV